MGEGEGTEARLQGRLFPGFSALHTHGTKGLSNLNVVTRSSGEKEKLQFSCQKYQ